MLLCIRIFGCITLTVLEKTLETPLGCKEFKPFSTKGNQLWIFIGMTVAEAEIPILWSADVSSWLIRKDPDAGKDWGQKKWVTEVETVGWQHWFNGHAFEQTQGDSGGQRSLACCSSQGHKESDMTQRLNNNNNPCMQWVLSCVW